MIILNTHIDGFDKLLEIYNASDDIRVRRTFAVHYALHFGENINEVAEKLKMGGADIGCLMPLCFRDTRGRKTAASEKLTASVT